MKVFVFYLLIHFILIENLHAQSVGVKGNLVDAKRVVVSSVSKNWANGLNSKILNHITKRLNLNMKIIHVPFARRLAYMETGRIDLMVGLLKSKNREKYIHFINPPYKHTASKVFFVLKGHKSSIKKYSDLKNLKIGVRIKSKYFKRFDDDASLDKVKVSKLSQSLRMLLKNRVDAVINSAASGIETINKMKIHNKIEIAEYYDHRDQYVYLGISKKSPLMDHVGEIEKELKKMVKSGEIKEIIKNYYSAYSFPFFGHSSF